MPDTRWVGTAAPRGDAYDARWRAMEAAGQNPHGEADFVMGFAPSSVLDAGCGTGRVAIELARRGVTVAGADLDPGMLDQARANAPDLAWTLVDLAQLDLRGATDERRRFDVVVAAGNVMIFLAPGTEQTVVARMADHLESDGSLIAGFQLGRGLDLDAYDHYASAAGLELEQRWATWDGQPFAGGDYAVSVHRMVR